MFYRIICTNPDHTEAYAERISVVEILPNGRAYYVDQRGSGFVTDADSIIENPQVIHACAGRSLYKIRLKGE